MQLQKYVLAINCIEGVAISHATGVLENCLTPCWVKLGYKHSPLGPANATLTFLRLLYTLGNAYKLLAVNYGVIVH